MKRLLLIFLMAATGLVSFSQELAPNQNPDYAISRDKYMKLADSVNRFQSTTSQDTYKAIDYLADKQEAKEERRQFRRDLRMERARWNNYNYGWNNDYYYGRRYNNFRPGFYNRPYYNYNNYWNGPATWGTIGSPFFWHWLIR